MAKGVKSSQFKELKKIYDPKQNPAKTRPR